MCNKRKKKLKHQRKVENLKEIRILWFQTDKEDQETIQKATFLITCQKRDSEKEYQA